MAKRKRRTFTPEFKAKVVLEALSGESSQAELCRCYNLSEDQLSNEYIAMNYYYGTVEIALGGKVEVRVKPQHIEGDTVTELEIQQPYQA